MVQRVLSKVLPKQSSHSWRRAFLRLHTLEFLGQPLAAGSIARLVWDVAPKCGIMLGAPIVAVSSSASTTQMLLEFSEPMQLSQFVSSLRAHMAPFLAKVESVSWGQAMLESISCCPICEDQQWTACMFHMAENISACYEMILPVRRSELVPLVRPGEYVFTAPRATCLEMAKLLHMGREVAGAIDLHWDAMQLGASGVRSGAKHHVPFLQAPFSFHTHPWSCPATKPAAGSQQQKQQCFIDVPSPEDVAGVIRCSLRKARTIAHIVLTTQGCYVLAVPADRPLHGSRAVAACERLFSSLDGRGHLTAGERHRFRHAWLRCMREHGIAAEYFARLQDLKLTLHVT
ncbi:hypothetical protein OEZ85_011000 [Tetradesmus obliquus]|uniref:Uncharacterized protein n=1 Tax=Tetradesmus obliquus TaxID=3088 RepID=A0ABY8TPN2_TETOB|nr:hypothetical protein OEZ85_011000 [Tetradesmus obliquus]